MSDGYKNKICGHDYDLYSLVSAAKIRIRSSVIGCLLLKCTTGVIVYLLSLSFYDVHRLVIPLSVYQRTRCFVTEGQHRSTGAQQAALYRNLNKSHKHMNSLHSSSWAQAIQDRFVQLRGFTESDLEHLHKQTWWEKVRAVWEKMKMFLHEASVYENMNRTTKLLQSVEVVFLSINLVGKVVCFGNLVE